MLPLSPKSSPLSRHSVLSKALIGMRDATAGYLPQRQHWLGLVAVLIGGLSSIWLNQQIEILTHGRLVGLSALTLAILIGMVLGNSIYPKLAPRLGSGVGFSKAQILRLAIILYGFKVTLTQVASVGLPAIMSDAMVLTSTFLITYWLGTRVLKIDRETTLLIGAGSSICGAAAVIATEPVLKAEAHKVTIAVATVVVFGTLAMLLYPMLYHLGWLATWLDPQQYGIYTGSSIHEVAQVVVAGNAVNIDVGNTAVVTKMIRVMMLAPFLLVLSFILTAKPTAKTAVSSAQAVSSTQAVPSAQAAATTYSFRDRLTQVKVPWFAFVFIAVVIAHTLLPLPERLVTVMVGLDNILLTMAMFALGLTTHLSAIKQAGIKPLLLGAMMFGWLILGGAAINVLVSQVL